MPIHLLGALAAICLLTPVIHARTSVVVTLSSVGDRVRAQNPQLKAARKLIQEAVGRALDAGRLDNPTFESSFEAGPGLEERNLDIGLAQAFPVTSRLRLEKAISTLEIKAAEAEVADTEQRLMASARELAVDLMALRQRQDLMREQAGIYKTLTESLRNAADKGESSMLDAGQAQLEANQLALEMNHLSVDETSLVGELKVILGMTPAEQLRVAGKLPPPVESSGISVADRPDYQAAMIRVESAQREVELEQAHRVEDVEVGVFASSMRKEDAPDGLKSDLMLGLKLNIPLPLWNRNQGAIDESNARHQRRLLEAKALVQTLSVRNETVHEQMLQWRQVIHEIDNQLMPLAEQQTTLAEQGYRAGQTEIQTVLRAREQHLGLLVSRLDALRKYHLARVGYPTAENSIPTSSNDEN